MRRGAPALHSPIGVVVIDTSPLILSGIRGHIQRANDLRLVAEATDGAEGLQRIAEVRPDVALIDLMLPGMDGLTVAAQARRVSPATRTVIITGDLWSTRIAQPLPKCVDGYFHKCEPISWLVSLVRRVYCGTPEVSCDSTDPLESLTLPEQVVLLHLTNGATIRQTAFRMQISYKSADHQAQSLMRKLDLHDRASLVHFAIRRRSA